MHQSGPHTYLYGVEIMNLENTYITTWNPGMHFYNDIEQILFSKKSMLLTFFIDHAYCQVRPMWHSKKQLPGGLEICT